MAPSTDKWLRPLPSLHPKMLVTPFSAQVSYLPVSSGRDRGKEEGRKGLHGFSNSSVIPFSKNTAHYLSVVPSILRSCFQVLKSISELMKSVPINTAITSNNIHILRVFYEQELY